MKYIYVILRCIKQFTFQSLALDQVNHELKP